MPTRHKKESALVLKEDTTKVTVLLALLQQNREEIRFWHGRVFATSFWFDATILGVVSFSLAHFQPTSSLRYVVALGCICLAGFHFVIARIARKSIELSGHDLLAIQSGLLLTEPDHYLKNNAVYAAGDKWLPPNYIWILVGLNLALSVGSIVALFAHVK